MVDEPPVLEPLKFYCKGNFVFGGWLIVLGLTAIRGSISVYTGPSPKERERGVIDERQNVQATPSAPTTSSIGSCPTMIQISRTPQPWKFTQHQHTTRPPPFAFERECRYQCWYTKVVSKGIIISILVL